MSGWRGVEPCFGTHVPGLLVQAAHVACPCRLVLSDKSLQLTENAWEISSARHSSLQRECGWEDENCEFSAARQKMT